MLVRVAFLLVNFIDLLSQHETEACSTSGSVSEEENQVIDTIQALGRRISYAQWENDPKENVVLSPLSITTILNLLLMGTESDSNLELKEVLNYPSNLQEIDVHEVYQSIFTSLKQLVNGIEIGLFTRLFIRKDFSVFPSYINSASTYYFSDVEYLDFMMSPETATERINSWVSESTKGKINELFSDPLDIDTVCVATNVIFFNATWENQFITTATTNGIFYAESENIAIPMMTKDMNVRSMRDQKNGFEMIALPYEGKRFSMYIAKPENNENISELKRIESILDEDLLNTSICLMSTEMMTVTLPRMKLTSDLDLKKDLESFGVNKIFSEVEADFRRFTNRSKVYVSFIVHKAILEITEAGTTAAAVTAAVLETESIKPSFIVDRPFLLFIRDDENGVILFSARAMRPEPIFS